MTNPLQVFDSGISEIQSAVNLTHLSQEQLFTLRLCVAEFKASRGRIEREFLILSSKLAMMKEILGDQFIAFAKDDLGLPIRTVQRYLTINQCMEKHLSTGGRIDIGEAQLYTQGALSLLAPVTDDDVIEEVRGLAQSGAKISEAVVRDIIASRNVDYEGRIALAESDAAAATNQLREVESKRELESSRMKSHIERQDEIHRRDQEKVAALEEDLERLRGQATVVTEREVDRPVVPPGYATIADAIAAAERDLAQARSRASDATREADELATRNVDLKASLATFTADTQDFLRVKTTVEELLLQMPKAHLQAIAARDADVKEALEVMGRALIQFGTQLCTATASA